MAKQSGLHQIRGKVGEHSYYKQTGVASGLIRSINQGMSQRVKTADEYANVRLNNAEFGQAGRISKVLGMFISPKYRPMLLPFSQSKMCKIILEAIKKDDNAPWGQRNISSLAAGANVLVNALNSVRKNDPESYGLSISLPQAGELTVSINETLAQAKMTAIGADGYDVRTVAASPWIGMFAGDSYGDSYARGNYYDETGVVADDGAFQVNYAFRPAPSAGWPAFQQEFFVIIIMPFRTINNVKYTLQEHCTYFAAEVPASA